MKVLPKTWVSPNNRWKISDKKLEAHLALENKTKEPKNPKSDNWRRTL